MSRITSARVVKTSFVVDISDVALNLAVALLSGSTVMLVRTMQGAADLVTSGLLVIGVNRSRRKADKKHDFGYGREIYFWTLISGLMMLTITATVSFREGLQHVLHPEPLQNMPLALGVLVIGLVTNGYAFWLGWRRLSEGRRAESVFSRFASSTLVETKAAVVLDFMGTMSGVLGFIALLLYVLTGDPRYDGVGAMVIGVGIGLLAILLVLDVKDLLIGRSVSLETQQQIKKTAVAINGVKAVLDLRTMHLGSEQLLINMELQIEDHLKTSDIEQLMDLIKASIKDKVPTVHHIQIEVETPHRRRVYAKKFS